MLLRTMLLIHRTLFAALLLALLAAHWANINMLNKPFLSKIAPHIGHILCTCVLGQEYANDGDLP